MQPRCGRLRVKVDDARPSDDAPRFSSSYHVAFIRCVSLFSVFILLIAVFCLPLHVSYMNMDGDSKHLVDDGRMAVEQALLLLPPSFIRAYAAAKLHVPSLVASESDPLLFFLHANRQVRTAAVRLASYWNM